MIATSTDYDAWREGEEVVTTAEVIKVLKNNADTSRHVTAHILDELHAVIQAGDILSEEEGCMKFSIMGDPAQVPEKGKKRLAYILPQYFA